MANKIEYTNTSASKHVVPTSRYYDSKVIYYTEQKLITFEIYKKGSYQPSDRDQFYIIEKGYEFRPDLIAFKKYGEPNFWWKIMEVNGMKDIMEFKAGANIILPNNIY